MVGGYLKDILLLGKHWFKLKFVISFVAALILAIIFLRQDSAVISIFITMLFLNSIQSLFNDDNKSGFLDFLNTTGVSFNRIVFARYLTGISLCLISSIFSFLVNLIIYVFYKNLPLKSYLFIGLLTLIISLMYMLILIPFIYLFNQNGLTIAVILIILIAFILSKVNHSALKISNFFHQSSNLKLGFYCVLCVLLTAGISYIVSVIICKKRFYN